MKGQKTNLGKSHGGGWLNREIKLFGLFLTLISFSNLIFSNNTLALYTPTLSVSVDQTNLQVDGNQVIDSADQTTEIPLNLIVNTNNRTGYTATLNSKTDETALVNTESATGAKIDSIDANKTLAGFSDNTWGVKVGSNTNFSPIPKPTAPMNVMQTAGKTNGNESNQLSIGMKLSDNLESGRYTNKLVFSILTNDYNQIAMMTEGPDFNTKLKSLEPPTSEINYFRKSPVPPATSMNAVNIEDEESDYEIKLWLDPTDKTAYYYTETEKVYLNSNSSKMFYSDLYEQKIRNVLEMDLSNFDTSKVTNMSSMFLGMVNLTTLNLSNFNTSQVTNMGGMFGFMSNLTSLNLISFDTSQVTNMAAMFFNIVLLTTLDLSNFNTSQVTNMNGMFSLPDMWASNDKLEKIYVNNDFNTSKLTTFSNIFSNRKKLRGGNGSYLTDPSTADKSWLRVDRPGVHGYFTKKS